MRFFLDQNVDARLRRRLQQDGHDAWTADEANLADEVDPNLTVYADDQHAVLVTHDREFSQSVRRRMNCGRHVWLHCDPLAGPGLLMAYLPDVRPILERHDVLFVEMTVARLDITYPSQRSL